MSDDALIEAMAKAMSESGNKDWMYADDWFKDIYIGQAIAALAVCRPIIEAQAREKCALVAEGVDMDPYYWGSIHYGGGFRTAREKIAAAIRETGDE